MSGSLMNADGLNRRVLLALILGGAHLAAWVYQPVLISPEEARARFIAAFEQIAADTGLELGGVELRKGAPEWLCFEVLTPELRRALTCCLKRKVRGEQGYYEFPKAWFFVKGRQLTFPQEERARDLTIEVLKRMAGLIETIFTHPEIFHAGHWRYNYHEYRWLILVVTAMLFLIVVLWSGGVGRRDEQNV
jgi:hypothetical protein